MNKRWFVCSLLIAIFLCIQLSSAAIVLTEPKEVYSIGDELNVNATLQPVQGGNGFFVATLKCDSRDVELMRLPYSTKPGQSSSFTITATLDRALIGSLQGDCVVRATYGNDDASTSKFKLSSNIIISIDIQGNQFEPKDDIELSGTALLVNSQPVEGLAVFEISKTNISMDGTVSDGKFSKTLTLPNSIASGTYDIKVIISQRDEYGNTMNTGTATQQIKVKQVVQSAEVALSNITVEPGTELSYQLVLYDQVLAKAVQDATVRLISPTGVVVDEKLVNSAGKNSFSIGRAYAPGIWTVQASTGAITSNKSFGITENEDAQITLDNSTLVIVNTGNVPYNDPVEVLIGDTTESIELDLAVGAEKRMKLYAPAGNYAISIKSGEKSTELGTAALTGKAIQVSDLSDSEAATLKMWFWIIAIIVIGIFAYRAYRKFRSNRVFISPSSSAVTIKSSRSSSESKDDSFLWKAASSPVATEARKLSDLQRAGVLSKSVDYGRKEDSSVLVLKIKNYDELAKYKGSEPAMNAIVQAAGLGRSAKAKVSRESNFTVMTFSKTSTGSDNPQLQAAKVGKEIESLFKSHNRKYARKISFGLGLATGEMIVEKQGSTIQHTATGAVIPLAKKIATHAHDALLLDNNTHSKLRTLVKSEKGIGGMYWSIMSFISRENHNEFIKKFMERRADETKSF